MKDFIYGLYSNDNFTTYLVIALIVLVILFVIVLLFGKKDQKLEETKKLQKLELEKSMPKDNVEAFKEESITPVKIEAKEEPVLQEEEKPLEAPTPEPTTSKTSEVHIKPTTDVTSFFDDTQILPTVDTETSKEEKKVNVTTFEPNPTVEVDVKPAIELPKEESQAIFTNDEDSPITINDLPTSSFDDQKMEQDLTELENIKNEFNRIEIPELEKKEEPQTNGEVKKSFQPNQVFSSVFVDSKPQATSDETPVTKSPEEKINIFQFEDDEDTIELPSLK